MSYYWLKSPAFALSFLLKNNAKGIKGKQYYHQYTMKTLELR